MSEPKKLPIYEFYVVLGLEEELRDYVRGGGIRLAESSDHCYTRYTKTSCARVCIYSTVHENPPPKINERLMVALRSYHDPDTPSTCYFKSPYAMKEIAKFSKYRWDPEKKLWWTRAKVAPLFLARLIADDSYRRHILRPALSMHHEFRTQPARFVEPRSSETTAVCPAPKAKEQPEEWLD